MSAQQGGNAPAKRRWRAAPRIPNDPTDPLYLEYLNIPPSGTGYNLSSRQLCILMRRHPSERHDRACRIFAKGYGPNGSTGGLIFHRLQNKDVITRITDQDLQGVGMTRAQIPKFATGGGAAGTDNSQQNAAAAPAGIVPAPAVQAPAVQIPVFQSTVFPASFVLIPTAPADGGETADNDEEMVDADDEDTKKADSDLSEGLKVTVSWSYPLNDEKFKKYVEEMEEYGREMEEYGPRMTTFALDMEDLTYDSFVGQIYHHIAKTPAVKKILKDFVLEINEIDLCWDQEPYDGTKDLTIFPASKGRGGETAILCDALDTMYDSKKFGCTIGIGFKLGRE